MAKKQHQDQTDEEISEVLDEKVKDQSEETTTQSEVKEEGEGEPETKVVKVGEKEYTPDQLAEMVSKSEKLASFEKEHNVQLEKLLPDYTQKSQLLSDPVKLGQYIAQKFPSSPASPEEELKQKAIREAREVYGIITKQDLEDFKQSFMQEMKVNQLLETITEIEKEQGISKTDLLDFMKATKNDDPYDAAEKIANYQKMAGKKEETSPVYSERTGSSGSHIPPGKKLPSIDDTEGMKNVITDMLQSSGEA